MWYSYLILPNIILWHCGFKSSVLSGKCSVIISSNTALSASSSLPFWDSSQSDAGLLTLSLKSPNFCNTPPRPACLCCTLTDFFPSLTLVITISLSLIFCWTHQLSFLFSNQNFPVQKFCLVFFQISLLILIVSFLFWVSNFIPLN